MLSEFFFIDSSKYSIAFSYSLRLANLLAFSNSLSASSNLASISSKLSIKSAGLFGLLKADLASWEPIRNVKVNIENENVTHCF